MRNKIGAVASAKSIGRPELKPYIDPVYPANNSLFFYVTIALSFLINFILYLCTLAPTVTLEDSGEFIAAAYSTGIPHEPGYPLFTLIGRLFTLLPFGPIAYRVNLLSAFFTALSCLIVFYATVLLIEHVFNRSFNGKPLKSFGFDSLKYGAGLSSAILFGTALSTWEQAIITEVYGLNSFFTSIFIFLTLLLIRQRSPDQKQRYCIVICYVLGLTLANHTTSAMLIPLFGIFVLLMDYKMLKEFGVLVKSFSFFILGLTTYLYLPIASRKNPIMDWGNPDTITNFIRVVTRHQYENQVKQTVESFGSQFAAFAGELLLRQWVPVFLLFSLLGLIILFKKQSRYFYFSIAFMLFAMPVTTYFTNFPVNSPQVALEHKALVSVFYIPAYLFLAILIGIGLFYSVSLIKMNIVVYNTIAICLPLICLGCTITKNYSKVDMHGYYYARDYSDNIFNTLPRDALLLVNWDPYSFPLMYYQFVEHKRPDLLVIDQQLLKRSWYIHWLTLHYPDFTKPSEKEIAAFLNAIAPFESNQQYNGEILQQSYIAMINSFIDNKIRRNAGVYFAYTPEPAIMRNYHLEPLYSAYRYTQSPNPDTSVVFAHLKLESFIEKKTNRDRMANYLREYYGNLMGLRAMQFESSGNRVQSKKCYVLARRFFDDTTKQAVFIEQKLSLFK
jgi:hypothetical protein